MIIHLILDELDTTVEQTVNKPVSTELLSMFLEIFTHYEATLFWIIWTFDRSPLTFGHMAIHVTTANYCITIFIWTCD